MSWEVPASHGWRTGWRSHVLILTRKVDESIVLTCPDGTRIDVMVTDIRRADSGRPYCKLGITAPQAVIVRRDELKEFRVFTEGKTDVAGSDSDE